MSQSITSERSASLRQRASTRSWAVTVARDDRDRRIVLWILLILLFRQTLAGPIRAYVPFLWYIPDFAMLVGFGVLIYQAARDKVVPLLVFCGLLSLVFIYSTMSNSLVAVSLQARQAGYLILAALAGIGIRRGNTTVTKAIAISGGIAILGVYYDYIFGVPWANAIFDGLLQTKEVAREWWGAAGMRRLSGFGLSSTDTSVIIAVGALSFCALTRSQLRLTSAVYAAAAVHTLLLTTQKATAGWLVIVLVLAYAVPIAFPRRDGFSSAPLLRMLGLAGLAGCILIPAIFFGVRLGQDLDIHAPTLDQRMADVWPTVIPKLWAFPQLIAGYGLGGVGHTATIPGLETVDNMFLYTALSVGMPLTLAIFGAFAYGLWKAPMRDAMDFAALAIASLVILNGITANILAAGGVGSMYLGLAAGILLRPTRRSAPSGPTGEAPSSTPSGSGRRRRRRSSSSQSAG